MTAPRTRKVEAIGSEHGRFAPFDGLRAAVVLIASFHFFALRPPLTPAEGLWFQTVRTSGAVGLEVFFAISGLLITGILLDTRDEPGYYRNFFARRLLRILPVYYGFLVIWLWLLPALFAAPPSFLASAVRHQFYYWSYSLNLDLVLAHDVSFSAGTGHLWSLMVEEQFYLAWPVVVRTLSPQALGGLARTLAVLSPALRISVTLLRPEARLDAFDFPLTHCESLAFGAWLALDARAPAGLSRWRRRAGWMSLAGAALVAGTLAKAYLRDGTSIWRAEIGPLACALLGGALVAATVTASPASRLLRALAHPALTRIGRYSYAAYVVHWPASVLLDELGVAELSDFRRVFQNRLAAQLAYTAGRLVVTLVLAALSWHLLEKRLLGLKRRFAYGAERAATPLARAADTPAGVR